MLCSTGEPEYFYLLYYKNNIAVTHTNEKPKMKTLTFIFLSCNKILHEVWKGRDFLYVMKEQGFKYSLSALIRFCQEEYFSGHEGWQYYFATSVCTHTPNQDNAWNNIQLQRDYILFPLFAKYVITLKEMKYRFCFYTYMNTITMKICTARTRTGLNTDSFHPENLRTFTFV